jgi:hypothetical protein
MPAALQLISGFATVGAAGTAVVTPSPGDTFTVQQYQPSASATLEQFWIQGASIDWVRIRSPRMHDANQGLRVRTAGTNQRGLLPWEISQPLYAVDTPIVEIDQTAAASGLISALYWYSDLGGVNPRLAHAAEVVPRIRQVSGVEVALSACAAIGSYSPGVALNATNDNFEAGGDYALLGYEVASSVASISIVGQDTGNLRVGGPGSADPFETKDWFLRASRLSNAAYVPIIAANNKGSTLISQVDNTAHAAQNITLILALLGS